MKLLIDSTKKSGPRIRTQIHSKRTSAVSVQYTQQKKRSSEHAMKISCEVTIIRIVQPLSTLSTLATLPNLALATLATLANLA